MKLFRSLLIYGALAAIILPITTSARSAPEGFSDLVKDLMPAVVNISSSQKIPERRPIPDNPFQQLPPGSPLDDFRDFFDKFNPNSSEDEQASLGSGFIIDPSGYIATNNHVIADAEEVTVILSDDIQLKAKIIGRDIKTDLALLKVDAPQKLPYVSFGDSDDIHVGDWVIAIGNPFGLGGSVSAGIISARARDINSGPFDDFLQTDAAINRGNSGGPMFNMDGDVVGINTAIFSPTGGSVGIGFAVPSALAKPIFKQLRETGKVERGWLGVKIQDVSPDIAESIGLKKPTGALVVGVTKGSPADKGGLIPGDVILRFDNKKVTEMRKLPRIVAETKIGKNVEALVLHKDEEVKRTIIVSNLDEPTDIAEIFVEGQEMETLPEGAKEVLGLTLVEIDDEARSRYGVSYNTEGLLVIKVDTNSTIPQRDLQPGDVIISANQDEVLNVTDFLKALTDTKAKNKSSVLLLVEREGEGLFTTLPITNN